MNLYIEDDKGIKTEIKEIGAINKECDILFLLLNKRISKCDTEALEEYMSNKIGKKIIILDSVYDKVMGM